MSETLRFETLVTSERPAFDIVFVHGLTGDPRETWTSAGEPGEVWPCWLASDLPGTSIHTLGYGSSFLAKWAAKEMNLYALAESALELLSGHGIGTRPVAFIGHSLGGLVIKQILRSAREANITAWAAIADRSILAAFISTPHQGATIAQVFKFIAPKLSSVHIDLISNETGALTDLNNAYRDFAPTSGIRTLAYYETHKTKAAAFIVDKLSADPGVAGTRAIAIEGDHISVCKPADRDALLYVSLRNQLRDVMGDTGKDDSEAGKNGKSPEPPPQPNPAVPGRTGNIAVASGPGSIAIGGNANGATFNAPTGTPAPAAPAEPAKTAARPDETDALSRAGVENAAKRWAFRVVLSVDLAGAGPRFKDFSEGLGAKGGEAFQAQVRGFIGSALDGVPGDEGVWQWTGDGALLAFSDANRAHDFAIALHHAAEAHNRSTTTPENQRHFRVGMAATDDPERESWDYSVMRAARLESKADIDGILIDIETWAKLHSSKRALYGEVERIPGKRSDEFYEAHRYPAVAAPDDSRSENGGPGDAEPEESIAAPPNPHLHNLPPAPAHFRGRATEEAALLERLRREGGTQAITALRGIGGIGKTALAVRVARQLLRRYPAAQILIELRGTETDAAEPRAAMEDVIRRFVPTTQLPDDDAGVAEIYRDLLTQHKSLLILDNARDGAQVQSLLPPPPSAAIVTARRQIDLPMVVPHGLDNLARADAIALLADLFADRTPSAVPEAKTLGLLAAACVDHPLALTVAGTYAANRADRLDIARYAAQIAEQRERLRLEGIADHDVVASLSLSLERLTEEDRSLAERWRDLAVFPADFDAAAAAAVWGGDTGAAAASDTLSGLADRGFLETGRARFRLHDLMHDLARLDQDEDRFAATEARHGSHYLNVLAAAEELYLAGGTEKVLAGLALYDLEQENIRMGRARRVRAMQGVGSAEAGDLVYQYTVAGVYVLNLRQHPREAIGWWEDAAEGARLSENQGGESAALGNLGLAFEGLGKMEKAIDYHERALVISRQIGDRRSEGQDLGNLGNAYKNLGETEKAIFHHQQALAISREIGDRRGEGQDLGNLGNAYKNLGETEKAIVHHQQALAISREIGDRRGEGEDLGNLGNDYADLGETEKAIDHYEQQIVIAREIGDRRGEGNALANLGLAYEKLERFTEARAAWTAALALFDAIGDPNAERVRELLAGLGE